MSFFLDVVHMVAASDCLSAPESRRLLWLCRATHSDSQALLAVLKCENGSFLMGIKRCFVQLSPRVTSIVFVSCWRIEAVLTATHSAWL